MIKKLKINPWHYVPVIGYPFNFYALSKSGCVINFSTLMHSLSWWHVCFFCEGLYIPDYSPPNVFFLSVKIPMTIIGIERHDEFVTSVKKKNWGKITELDCLLYQILFLCIYFRLFFSGASEFFGWLIYYFFASFLKWILNSLKTVIGEVHHSNESYTKFSKLED